jgi:L-ascorbate metabolism protein UlaG (beta-lactamase superfamily)
MRITNYGHSCIGVRVGTADLLFDPFISGNPQAKGIHLDAVPATHVLITHGHGDHVMDAEAILARTGAQLFSNYEIVNWFGAKGVTTGHGLNIGGSADLGNGLKAKYVLALHSSQLPDGAYGGHPGGWVITSTEGSFYHAGDTALTMDMQLLKTHHLKFAFLPIGDTYTMGVEDAIEAARFCGVTTVIGIHYNSFPPITIEPEAAQAAFRKAGLELLLPAIGSTIER